MANPNKPLIKLIYSETGKCLGYGYFRRPNETYAVFWEWKIQWITNNINRVKEAVERTRQHKQKYGLK